MTKHTSLVKTDAVNEDGDIVYVTIDEWKRMYGQPGLLVDIHGRINGTYPTEPDYCEKAGEAA